MTGIHTKLLRSPDRIKNQGNFLTAVLPALVAIFLLGSCASLQPRLPDNADPLNYLPRGAALYARLSRPALADIAPSILPGDRSGTLATIVDRAEASAMGSTPASRPGAMNYDLALIGNYPRATVNLALTANPEWRAEGQTFVNDPQGIVVAAPVDRLVLARSIDRPSPATLTADKASPASLPKRIEAFNIEGSSPLPPRFPPPYQDDIFIWIADPFTTFAAWLPSEDFELPILGISLAGIRTESFDPKGVRLYRSTVAFVMRDGESARIYRPSLKFAWFALSRAFLGEGDRTGLEEAARFTLDGDTYAARDILIPATTYSSLFGFSRNGSLPE